MPEPSPEEGAPSETRLLDALGDGVLVLDHDGTVLRANEAAELCLEADPVGETVAALFDGDPTLDVPDDGRRRVMWERPREEPAPPGTPAAGSHPDTQYVEATLTRTTRDGDPVVLASLRDVTDRVAREQSLKQHERVVATMPDGVFVVDETGRMVGGNEAMAEMIGEEAAGLRGKPFADLVADGILESDVLERYGGVVNDLLLGSEHEMVEIEVTPPGERTRIYECHVTLRPPDDGSFTGIVGVARDVTERVESQTALREQNERLERFASVVTHDLRNPLSVLKGRLSIYRDSGDTEQLEAAIEAAGRMDEIVSELLTLARQGESLGETTAVSLEAAATESWSYVETGTATLTVDDASFEADPDRLSAALENLFGNSIEHGAEGDLDGTDLQVTVGPLGDPADPDGFYVTDTGGGIPGSVADDLFEHGVSGDAQGSGFGLGIVRRVAEAHGWSVTAGESESGGARFDIRFDG
jgi:PAS domain S-box-containing protein